MRRQDVDSELSRVTGLDVWAEEIRGAVVVHSVDTRHLRNVLRERTRVGLKNDAHESRHLKDKQPLRVVKADRKRESA